MATMMNSHTVGTGSSVSTRTSIQKVCIGLGVAFVAAGVAGILMPGFMGMHLSTVHNIIHIVSGALALAVGYGSDPRKAYVFALAFGAVYGLLGIAGFVMGTPGYPGTGHLEADQNLFRIIPNVLEFGTMDHVVHILLGAAFLISAYAWKRADLTAGSSIVDVQRRKSVERTSATSVFDKDINDIPNSQSDLTNANLGSSDVNHTTDMKRRTDFEHRI